MSVIEIMFLDWEWESGCGLLSSWTGVCWTRDQGGRHLISGGSFDAIWNGHGWQAMGTGDSRVSGRTVFCLGAPEMFMRDPGDGR